MNTGRSQKIRKEEREGEYVKIKGKNCIENYFVKVQKGSKLTKEETEDDQEWKMKQRKEEGSREK